MAAPQVTTSPTFERISSPYGSSPFDKAMMLRDRAVLGLWVARINKFSPFTSYIPEMEALNAAVFPGEGGFGTAGGPLV